MKVLLIMLTYEKCCLDAIERFKSGKTKNVSHNAKISVLE